MKLKRILKHLAYCVSLRKCDNYGLTLCSFYTCLSFFLSCSLTLTCIFTPQQHKTQRLTVLSFLSETSGPVVTFFPVSAQMKNFFNWNNPPRGACLPRVCISPSYPAGAGGSVCFFLSHFSVSFSTYSHISCASSNVQSCCVGKHSDPVTPAGQSSPPPAAKKQTYRHPDITLHLPGPVTSSMQTSTGYNYTQLSFSQSLQTSVFPVYYIFPGWLNACVFCSHPIPKQSLY